MSTLDALFFDIDDTLFSTSDFAASARRASVRAMIGAGLQTDEEQCLRELYEVIREFGPNFPRHFEKLLRGVSAEKDGLDAALAAFLDRPIEQVDLMERVVLRIGAFEMIHCPELPFRVVLQECVDLAHRFGSEQGHAYVNAVLDQAARQWRAGETGSEAGGTGAR